MVKFLLRKHKFSKILLILWCTTAFNPSYALPEALDVRHSSSTCSVDKEFVLSCDYRYSPRIDVKNVLLEIDGKEVQVKPEEHKFFPATKDQKTSVLILVDVSDPKRKNTVEVKYGKTIGEIIKASKPHHQIGLAEFDSDIRVLSPIGSDNNSLLKASQSIKATGQSTEFYKNILGAIDIVKRSAADRRGLIVLSDGKDEDRAYKLEDVLKLAKDSNVSILSLGYLEKQQDTPFLQTMKRMSEDTHGLFFEVADPGGSLPENLITNPFAFIEKGGRITYQLPKLYVSHEVNLALGRANGEKIVLSNHVDPIDERTDWQKLTDFVFSNWIWVSIGFFISSLLVIGFVFFIVKKIRRSKPVNYATLVALDGVGTKYTIQNTANRLGRSADNEIRLMNDSISSHHAEIHRRREGVFFIVDLGSTNGVYVNDEKVQQTELKNNDIIELGEVRLRFSLI